IEAASWAARTASSRRFCAIRSVSICWRGDWRTLQPPGPAGGGSAGRAADAAEVAITGGAGGRLQRDGPGGVGAGVVAEEIAVSTMEGSVRWKPSRGAIGYRLGGGGGAGTTGGGVDSTGGGAGGAGD